MRILVLDDNLLVVKAPASFLNDSHDYRKDTIIQAASPEAFWKAFDNTYWDSVWLDHDLGTPEYSGKTITRAIYDRNQPVTHVGEFVITTMNPSVVDNMCSDLACTGVPVWKRPISFYHHDGIERGDLIPHHQRLLAFYVNRKISQ